MANKDIIKKGHLPVSYTPFQMKELLLCMNDPIHFIENYIKVQHPIKGSVPLVLYDYQREMVEVYNNQRFVISMTARQMGKCVSDETLITVKNTEGQIYNLPIGSFYRLNSNYQYVLDVPQTEAISSVQTQSTGKLSDGVERKFINTIPLSDWQIETDTGWENINNISITIKYKKYRIELEGGLFLEGADNHIVFDERYNERFIKDLTFNELILTKWGPRRVIAVIDCHTNENMYDIEVDSKNHRYYTNDILSHNTTVAAAFLLWKAMMFPDTQILIAANKFSQAMEIMDRIRYSYEECTDQMRAGVVEYNKGTITFDNGSKITARATTADAGRGLSISLLYMDEFAWVRGNVGKEFFTAIQPTLATGGSCIITSTPRNDEDQFAQIWKGAVDNTDEYGETIKGGVGKNGYYPIKVSWDKHPDRDEEWAKPFRQTLGEAKFRQEMNCCVHSTEINIADNNVEKQYQLGDLFLLLKDNNKGNINA